MEIWIYNSFDDSRKVEPWDGGPLTIGRDTTCALHLNSPFVSRIHARVNGSGGNWSIVSCGVNPIQVGNVEIGLNETAPLKLDEEIKLGEFSIWFTSGDQAPQAELKHQDAIVELAAVEREIHDQLLRRLDLRMSTNLKVDPSERDAIVTHIKEIFGHLRGNISEELRHYLVSEYFFEEASLEIKKRVFGEDTFKAASNRHSFFDAKVGHSLKRVCDRIIAELDLSLTPESHRADLAALENELESISDWARFDIRIGMVESIVEATIVSDIIDTVFGLGPLQPLIDLTDISEIMVIDKDRIYVERGGRIEPARRRFISNDVVLNVIERIVSPLGQRIDRSQPLVDTRLPDGSRVNAIIPPLAISGPALTIRKFSKDPFTIDDLIDFGTLTPRMAHFLKCCVMGRKNLVISGGTGSGKTTLLNVLSSFISPEERIVTIEDSAELQLRQRHVVRLESRQANIEGKGAFTIRDLVRNALRMRPDRVVVGECRGGEALDMLQAMNTGHDGSLTTAHANSPQELIARLETMVLMAADMPMAAIRSQIVGAIDVIVQISRFPNGARRVTHIAEVVEIDAETGEVVVENIFARRAGGTHTAEAVQPAEPTGYIPRFTDELVNDQIMQLSELFG